MLSKRTDFLIAVAAVLMAASQLDCRAQFKTEAFSQQYNDDKPSDADSTEKVFDVKAYFRGLSHKQEIDVTAAFSGSTLIPGGMQIYNRDYWKLPIVYGGIGAGVAGGIIYGKQGNREMSNICYIAAGVTYWATLLDGVIQYRPNNYPAPGKAPLYSLLVPGLGQIYNHEWWKLPVYYGIMIGGVNYYCINKRNFERFRNIYNNAYGNNQYDGPVSAETAKYYRDVYRRYRDYSVLVIAGSYLLMAIDANVFAYMHNFEVSDELAMDLSPRLFIPEGPAYGKTGPQVGLSLALTF